MAYLNKNKYQSGGYNFIGSYVPSQKRVDEYLQQNPRQERVQLSEAEIRELSKTAEGRERLFRMRNPNTFVTSEQAKNMPNWYRQQNPNLNRIIIDDSLERKLRSKSFRDNLSKEDKLYVEELLRTKKGKVPAVITYNPTEYYKGDKVGAMLFDSLPGKSFQDEKARGSRSASKNLIQQLESLIKQENIDSGKVTLPMRPGPEKVGTDKPVKLPSFKEQTNPMTFTDSDREQQDIMNAINTVSVNQEEMNRLNAPKKVEVVKKDAPVINHEMEKITGPKTEMVDKDSTNIEKAQATMDSVREMVNMTSQYTDPSSYERSEEEEGYIPQSVREREEIIPQTMQYETGGVNLNDPPADPPADPPVDPPGEPGNGNGETDDITAQQLEEIKQLREDMLAMQEQLNAQQNPLTIVQKNKSRYPNLFQLNQAKLARIFG